MNSVIPTLLILTLGVASTTAQSSWQTINDYQTIPGKGAAVSGVAGSGNGTVFTACMVDDPTGKRHGIVRRSLDGGATWVNVFDVPGAEFANCWAVTVGPSGRVFATASARLPGGASSKNWLTMRSEDAGETWSVVDFYVAAGSMADPWSVAEDSAGRVFVGGRTSDTQGRQHFLVRRSLDGGTTWITVDDVGGGSVSAYAVSMTATPSGVFVAGRMGNAWIVRRSTNGGNTWATVDQFTTNNGAQSHGIASDTAGRLYAIGTADITIKKNKTVHWMVRRSVDNGSTWQTVDDVVSGSINNGRAITVDAAGRIFATGQIIYGTTDRWVTRVSANGGATWSTTDDYALSSSGVVLPRCAGVDDHGNVFVGGNAQGADGVAHAVLRKLSAP